MVQGELSWGKLVWAEEAPEMQEVVGEAGRNPAGWGKGVCKRQNVQEVADRL